MDHKVKNKRKYDYKYLDLARELKKLENMKMMVIPIVVGALGTVPKGLEKRLLEMKESRPYRHGTFKIH